MLHELSPVRLSYSARRHVENPASLKTKLKTMLLKRNLFVLEVTNR